jgi:hypothetical protein
MKAVAVGTIEVLAALGTSVTLGGIVGSISEADLPIVEIVMVGSEDTTVNALLPHRWSLIVDSETILISLRDTLGQ